MRIRNKKTGERGVINHFDNQSIVIYPIDENWNAKGDKKYVYTSLAELNEEWEDYERVFWYIDETGFSLCGLQSHETDSDYCFYSEKDVKRLKEIGNYFETKEEAEKAVEKLKAWKRFARAESKRNSKKDYK